jgi:Bardet-Biedl syndrome 1 protein
VAVASGSHIYIYKNMRPYFKFTLPTLEIHTSEKELWAASASSEQPIDLGALCDGLQNLRTDIGDSNLTSRTQRLLMINDRTEAQAFVETHRSFPLKRQTVVTSIATLKKSHSDDTSVSCLVLGTESSAIYILDPEAFTIMESMGLPSAPAHLSVTGLYDVDFRIVAACRNGTLCTLKRGWSTARTIAVLESQAVGLIRREKTILVGTMDHSLVCFSSKGKKLWQLRLPANILCLEPIDLVARGLQLAAVALANKQVLLFNDKHVVDCFSLNDTVSAMKFGRFGREDSALVMITVTGGLTVKILKRTAQFERMESALAPKVDQQNQKLNIPKKTKLFVDQGSI